MQNMMLLLALALSTWLPGRPGLAEQPAPKTTHAPVPTQTQRDSQGMSKKIAMIMIRAETPPDKDKPQPPLRTSFTEVELNAWLATDGKDQLTPGLVSPRVTFPEAGKLATKILVDLDAVRRSKERGVFDLANLLSGVVEVSLTGALSGTAGQGLFSVESAYLGALPIPKTLLQELISYYSKSPTLPEGVTLDKPFVLPSGIRELSIQRGRATVVQ